MEVAPKRVAVLGGGVMGTGIAALMANNGIAVEVFDVKKELAEKCIKAMTDPRAKVPVLYSPRKARHVEARSLDELEARLGEADMIVEAVPEVLSIKQSTYEKVDAFRKPGSIICTNTSGLSINAMTEGRSEDFGRHFLGTHYFNPVRFMPLVELIPAETTAPEVLEGCEAWFARLGKKTLRGFDTPNFIANRIGIFAFMKAMALMEKYGFDPETVDMITGTAIGAPKTGTFRLADMVGIDTLYHVARNSYDNLENDEQRAALEPPAFLTRMIEEKKLGDKTRGGFYKKTRGGILTLDLETFEYREQRKPKSDCVRVAKKFVPPQERIAAMLTYDKDDRVCSYARELLLSTAAYALNRIGEAAPDVWSVDQALKWGFSREVGPIEALDSVGLARAAEMMSESGIKVPVILKEAIASTGRFYDRAPSSLSVYDSTAKSLVAKAAPEGLIRLSELRESGKVLRENLNARLYDLGDGVLGVEFDVKMVPSMNPIDDYIVSMLGQVFEVAREGYRAVVIGNQGPNFSAGAQLLMILELAKAKRFKEIEQVCQSFQMVNLFFKHADLPVVTAPHGLTLGGGLEVALSGHRSVAYAELYCGLVEVGVGLIPGAAGNLLLLKQFTEKMAKRNPGPMPPVAKTFELVGMAQVSKSAEQAVDMGLLKRDTVIVVDKAEQISRAKQEAISMCEGFTPSRPTKLTLPGKGGYLAIADRIDGMFASGAITPHSVTIGKKLAWVLTGGDAASIVNPITEMEFLANEREAFLELCGMKQSQERMKHMLKTGKPLLN